MTTDGFWITISDTDEEYVTFWLDRYEDNVKSGGWSCSNRCVSTSCICYRDNAMQHWRVKYKLCVRCQESEASDLRCKSSLFDSEVVRVGVTSPNKETKITGLQQRLMWSAQTPGQMLFLTPNYRQRQFPLHCTLWIRGVRVRHGKQHHSHLKGDLFLWPLVC